MNECRAILHVVERSAEAVLFLEKACGIAQGFDARMELFYCDAERSYWLDHAWDQSGVIDAKRSLIEDATGYLRQLLSAVDTRGVTVTVDARCQAPLYDGVLAKLRDSPADLVIKGFSTNTLPKASANDWNLIRACPVPLLLLQTRRWRPEPAIAAAVDVSQRETPGLPRRVVAAAARLGSACRGRVDVLHARRDTDAADARAALQRLAGEHGLPAQNVAVLAGEPETTLIEHVRDKGYDVLVLGALAHQPGIAAMVGSLTDRLIQQLDCDFLLLHAPG
ncbi:MAG: universal stress protein [Steroidobacteraceae bacterium]|nr:universal stress protein [Steroidobacteraceae bacterium]MDW8260418.1 universal stress protein [Gammaproteobacteria bacterium]